MCAVKIAIIVLTAKPYLYRRQDRHTDIPKFVSVIRAFGLDASRHLSFRKKYFGFLCIPDKYGSWIVDAVIKGLWTVFREKPDVIWSTFPYSSAHWAGLIIAKCTGLPWVADYRDPAGFHHDTSHYNWLLKWIDRKVVKRQKFPLTEFFR